MLPTAKPELLCREPATERYWPSEEFSGLSPFLFLFGQTGGLFLPGLGLYKRTQGYAVDGLENAQPGDLICYSGHVALYIGNGQIVHASNSKTGIIVSGAGYRNCAVRYIL